MNKVDQGRSDHFPICVDGRKSRAVHTLGHEPGDAPVLLRDFILRVNGVKMQRLTKVTIDMPIDGVAQAAFHFLPQPEGDEEPKEVVLYASLYELAFAGFAMYPEGRRTEPGVCHEMMRVFLGGRS